ncbi:hypothetical protein TYRP_017254 [Tyrophagus putrescentiae]|nr:hypothetical protein TYRP_017254 [Tyrophagus putrescentiae]
MPRGYDLEMTSGAMEADGNGGKGSKSKGSKSKTKSPKPVFHRAASTVAERAQQRLDNHPSEEESRRVSIPLLLVFVALIILIVYVIYLEFIA